MNTILKRVISLLLCFVMIAGYVPANAFAEETGETVTTETTAVTTEATGEPSEETEAPSESTEAPTDDSEITDRSRTVPEPSTEATEPSTEATEPSTEATEPSTEATEPSTEATEPSTEATEPSTEATEPSTEATEPSVPETTAPQVTEPEETEPEETEPEETQPQDDAWTKYQQALERYEKLIAELEASHKLAMEKEAAAKEEAAAEETLPEETLAEEELPMFATFGLRTANEGIATASEEGETIYILAGGDFQEGGDHANSAANVTNILAQVSQKYTTMDGFLFIGDYDCETHNDSTETANGITALMGAVQGSYSNLNDANSVLAQGNHDYMDSHIDATGGHEFDGYAAYVLNEDDYPNGGGSQAGIQTLANNLKTWLNNKIGEGYSAPIFIVSHLPLAFTPRTVTQGDAKYAKYIFDVLNDAGKNGLNIIFLHGHDHAYGPDNYMGGEAIYLPVGDKICIAEVGSTSAWTEETLNFTYMNAGYTGYYSDAYTYVTTAGTDKLTMTVFAITDKQVTVERYSEDGLYNLKSAGYDGSYSNTSVTNVSLGLPKYSAVYASPQTVALVDNGAADMGTIGEWVGIAAETPADDVTTSGGDWKQIIEPVPGTTGADDVTTSGNSWVTLTQPTGGTTTYIYTQVDTIEAGKEYVIVDGDNAVALNYTASSYGYTASMTGQSVTIEGSTIKSTAELPLWTFSGTGTANVNNGDYYLLGGNPISLLQYESEIFVVDNGDDFTLKRRERNAGYALYYNGTEWTTSSSNTQENVRLYELTDTSISGGSNGLYAYLKGNLTYNVTADTTAEQALAMVKEGIDIQYATAADYSDEKTYPDGGDGMTWTLDPSYDPSKPGDYAVTIAFNGKTIGVAEVITPKSADKDGAFGKVTGELSYTATIGMTADEAMAMVKAGIDGYYYVGMEAPAVNEQLLDDSLFTWEWVDTFDGNTAGDYAVKISYNGVELATAEVIVPPVTTYYMAEGNGLYLVDMNTTEANAMAAVKAGVTVYSATDANGSNKTAISDNDVTWNWVDTYNGADSGPYTVEILKDGTSLGTVEVKVNVQYETGINSDWTYIGNSEATGGTTTVTYTLDTDGIDYGEENKYIIVDDNEAIVLNANSSSNGTAHSITISGNTATTNTRDYEYHVLDGYSHNGTAYHIITKGNGSQYLYQEGNGVRYGQRSDGSVKFAVEHMGSGLYRIRDIDGTQWCVVYNGSSWTVLNTTNHPERVRFYKFVKEETVGGTPGGPIYALIEGDTVYTVKQGTSAIDALNKVKAGITGYTATDANGTGKTELEDSELTWKWKNTYASMATGSYWVDISYQGKVLGTVEVKVEPSAVNNYPEYPDEGAVKVNKTATGIDFQSSGIAQVEVSASGVPVKKGADVIVMLDTSSSMTWDMASGDGTRKSVMEAALKNLIAQFKANGDDGKPLDIRVAIADYNGFFASGVYGRDTEDTTVTSGQATYGDSVNAKVYTGDGSLGYGAFVNASELAETYTLVTNSGTNYDYAFDAIYQLGEASRSSGENRDLFVIFMSDGAAMQWNYYSGYGANTTWEKWITGQWEASDLTSANLNCVEHAYYYNLEDTDNDGVLNEHRMANAVKGSQSRTYEVIRKGTDGIANISAAGKTNMYNVPGLGATMFAICFDPAADNQVEAEHMVTSIETLASEQTGTTQYFYNVNNANALKNAFDTIGSEIAYAANNARFVDQMGDDFDLQLLPVQYSVVDGNETVFEPLMPTIEIISYDIYTRQDYLAGTITEDKIGDRKGTYTVLETITTGMVEVAAGTGSYEKIETKAEDGTVLATNYKPAEKGNYNLEVYSDQIGGGTTNILADGTQTGYVKGVIYAKTFLYNTNATPVAVDGVSIPTGTKADGTTTGSTNQLPSETFYWKMGTVQTSELAMRYYVYLEGSMEGTKEGGSYPTNEFATLYYDNYLNNPCKKDTVSPVMAWKEANVSYAFYLVDENGNIIVNQTTGQTGSFANKIAVTNPVVYETVLLNNDEEVSSIDIASLGVLPEGYTLYDYDGTNGATYTVTINSNTTGSWNITSVKDVATTYVMQYDPEDASAYSNELTHNTVGDDYTHTVVWFAVLWKVQALPDTVVIDYGLPVDISVLRNDMFGDNGKLAGVGAYSESLNLDGYDAAMAAGFSTSYTGIYGTAKADASTGEVRYTPSNMQMNGYDKFAYAVNYTGNENAGYYYDTVTVIPATTIYYEDSFLTYQSFTWNNGWEEVDNKSANWTWKQESKTPDGVQDEDRPGEYSLTDANNIYGYDSANLNMSTHSLNHAAMATVDYDNKAHASFTFWGTGFDIISMTSNTTGNILVDVEKYVGDEWTEFDNFAVDTYYGYKQDAEGNWIVDPDASGSLYQVPIIKMANKDYAKYRVTIKASYDPGFDHVEPSYEGSYDFYLDAIRIYDPANDGAADGTTDTTIEDAYKADGEGWPSYIELRNNIIAADSFDNVANDALTTDMEGLVFIDGDASVGDANISDYVSYGPNNEVYLAPGQRVAFLLSTPANIANIHIGVKSADGNTGTYTITNIAQATNSETGVSAGDYYGPKTSTIDTTTDMYYDLTGWKGDIIVISNTGDKYDTTGIISLTNIKSTYTSDPNGTVTASNDDSGIAVASVEGETSGETEIYMTPAAATLTLRSLNRVAVETPEETEPEESVPETTVPEESAPETTVPETTVPEETVPEETVPETTVPEGTEDQREQVEEAVKEVVQTVVNTVKNVLQNLFSKWFR